MDADDFAPEAYLERIGLASAPRSTAEGLEALHRAQAYTIPFENFDILLGRGVSLEPAHVFDKLVRRSRGGYCFELNGLLFAALRHFGFAARPLLARVHLTGTPTARSHMLLLAKVHGRDWIADAGFGGPGLRAPMPLDLEHTALQDGQQYRLAHRAPFGYLLQTRLDEAWRDLYSFDLAHVEPADIVQGNYFTSTHPTSFFTFSRVAALPLPGGRVTLLDRTLKRTATGGATELTIEEGQCYLDALKEHFGIALEVPYSSLPPLQRSAPTASG